MKFSRRATFEDIDTCQNWWNSNLSSELREIIEKGILSARHKVRLEKQCSLQQAKVIVDDYERFLEVLKDWENGKEIFVEY